MDEKPDAFSIALRVRRITCEDAYVAVPVTPTILKEAGGGSVGIDAEAFFAQAVRISQDPRVDWQVEGRQTEPHEEQCPVPQGRVAFDAFHVDET